MKTSNINVAFHRFENQDRHTVHMHMLIWLKNLGTVNLNHLRATIPNDHTYLLYLVKIVFHLQYSFFTNNTPHFVFPSKISVFFCNFKTHFILQVQLLQSSNKRNPSLKVNHDRTVVENSVVKFYHNKNDYCKMLRAYIDSITSNISLFSYFHLFLCYLHTTSKLLSQYYFVRFSLYHF